MMVGFLALTEVFVIFAQKTGFGDKGGRWKDGSLPSLFPPFHFSIPLLLS